MSACHQPVCTESGQLPKRHAREACGKFATARQISPERTRAASLSHPPESRPRDGGKGRGPREQVRKPLVLLTAATSPHPHNLHGRRRPQGAPFRERGSLIMEAAAQYGCYQLGKFTAPPARSAARRAYPAISVQWSAWLGSPASMRPILCAIISSASRVGDARPNWREMRTSGPSRHHMRPRGRIATHCSRPRMYRRGRGNRPVHLMFCLREAQAPLC